MKIFKLLIVGLSASLIALGAPAMAAVSVDQGSIIELTPLAAPTDCLASFDPASAIVFVEAKAGCDMVLAEATGLCLVPVAAPVGQHIAAVLDPELGISCTNMRPSPPG